MFWGPRREAACIGCPSQKGCSQSTWSWGTWLTSLADDEFGLSLDELKEIRDRLLDKEKDLEKEKESEEQESEMALEEQTAMGNTALQLNCGEKLW